MFDKFLDFLTTVLVVCMFGVGVVMALIFYQIFLVIVFFVILASVVSEVIAKQ